MTTLSLSVVIPTLNAAADIDVLLGLIEGQSIKPREILVVDSSSDDGSADAVAKHPGVDFHVIDRRDFNHGSTSCASSRRTPCPCRIPT